MTAGDSRRPRLPLRAGCPRLPPPSPTPLSSTSPFPSRSRPAPHPCPHFLPPPPCAPTPPQPPRCPPGSPPNPPPPPGTCGGGHAGVTGSPRSADEAGTRPRRPHAQSMCPSHRDGQERAAAPRDSGTVEDWAALPFPFTPSRTRGAAHPLAQGKTPSLPRPLSLGGCGRNPRTRERQRSPAGSSTPDRVSRPPVPIATPPLDG